MSTIEGILDNYDRLCAYCDCFFSTVCSQYANDMRCKKGCSACCVLHSVCALEAHVIVRNRVAVKTGPQPVPKKKPQGACVMLRGTACAIYTSRPVICRTHGLAISIDKKRTVCPTCTLNFTKRDVRGLPKPHVFDSAAITNNLMRLNLAFCMAIGHTSLASKRFTMEHVLSRELPKSIL
jgi:Fe-S-cluster containining protein